jgi:4-diphosphocytidyl-2-C-methyl-D-erythritol kinase
MSAAPRDGVTLAAPAKVNLALLVGPPRSDGFHEIASLVLPVTLADAVTVAPSPGDGLTVASEVCPGEQNLAARLVRELEARLDRSFEVTIDIRKQIPAGAGLGGGSSDAAATLVALERVFDLDLSWRLRYEVAAAVGSDVPFFLWPGPQLAMGRGQLLKDVLLPGPLHLVVAVPGLSLPTREVYGWRDEDAQVTLPEFAPRARMLSSRLVTARSVHDIVDLVQNDLEASVVARRPQVGALKDAMTTAGALAAAMTGSGSAVFGLFADEDVAGRARARLLADEAAAQAFVVSDLQPEPAGKRPPGSGASPGAQRGGTTGGRGPRPGARRPGSQPKRRGVPPRRRPRSR